MTCGPRPFDRRGGARSSCRRLPRGALVGVMYAQWSVITGLTVVFECCRAQCPHACSARSLCGHAAGAVGCAAVGHFLRQRQQVRLWGSCSSRREPGGQSCSGADGTAVELGCGRISSQRSLCTCVPTQELRAMNSQTWVPNWADGCRARAFLGHRRAFLQGREAVAISLYDALWWTDQLAKPDPMTERDGTRPSVERKLEPLRGLSQCAHSFSLRRTSQKCRVWIKKLRTDERAVTFCRRTHSTSSELVYTGEMVPRWTEDFTAFHG